MIWYMHINKLNMTHETIHSKIIGAELAFHSNYYALTNEKKSKISRYKLMEINAKISYNSS